MKRMCILTDSYAVQSKIYQHIRSGLDLLLRKIGPSGESSQRRSMPFGDSIQENPLFNSEADRSIGGCSASCRYPSFNLFYNFLLVILVHHCTGMLRSLMGDFCEPRNYLNSILQISDIR